MALKITSVTVVKQSDVPVTVKNTEMAQLVAALGEQVGKGIPSGKALSVKVAGAKKYTRYQLQKRLQKAGHKVIVRGKDDTYFISNAE